MHRNNHFQQNTALKTTLKLNRLINVNWRVLIHRFSNSTFYFIFETFSIVPDRTLALMGCVSGKRGISLLSFQWKVYVEMIDGILIIVLIVKTARSSQIQTSLYQKYKYGI